MARGTGRSSASPRRAWRGAILAVAPCLAACLQPPGDRPPDGSVAAGDAATDPPCVLEGEVLGLHSDLPPHGGRTLDAFPVAGGFAVLIDACHAGLSGLSPGLGLQVVRPTASGGSLPTQEVSRSACAVSAAWSGDAFGVLSHADPPGFRAADPPDFHRVSATGAMSSSTRLAEACSGERPGPVASVGPCRLLPAPGGWVLVAHYSYGTAWRTLAPDGALGPRVFLGGDPAPRGFAWGEDGPVLLHRVHAEGIYELVRYDVAGVPIGPRIRIEDYDVERSLFGGPLATRPGGFVMAYVAEVGEAARPDECLHAGCTVELRLRFLSPAAAPIGPAVTVERMAIPPLDSGASHPVIALEASGPEALVAYRHPSGLEGVLRLRAVRADGVVSEPLDLTSEGIPWDVSAVTVRGTPTGDILVAFSTGGPADGPPNAAAWIGSCR